MTVRTTQEDSFMSFMYNDAHQWLNDYRSENLTEATLNLNELATHDAQAGSMEAPEQRPVPVQEMPAIPQEIQLEAADSFSLRGMLSDCISRSTGGSASGGHVPLK